MLYGSRISVGRSLPRGVHHAHRDENRERFTISNLADYFQDKDIDVNIREEDFEETTKVIGKSFGETYQLNKSWVIRFMRVFVFYLVGCVFYMINEDWTIVNALYFITQTVTTVGYGNLHPITYNAQTFTIFYMFGGILLAFSVIGDVTSAAVNSMRKRYKKPITRNKLAIVVRNVINAGMWILILLCLVVFGTLVIGFNEGWTFHDAFYFCCVTVTSIGYGDQMLSKNSSIWFNIFYMMAGVAVTSLALDKISSIKRHIDEHELQQQLHNISLSKELLVAVKNSTTIKEHDEEREGPLRIYRAEYVLHMLQLAGRIDKTTDMLPWMQRFNEFDLERDGCLTLNDVAIYEKLSGKIKEKAQQLKTQRKKSILEQITEETKNVFLETIKMKEPENEGHLEVLRANESIISAEGLRSTVDEGTDSTVENIMISSSTPFSADSKPYPGKSRSGAAAKEGNTTSSDGRAIELKDLQPPKPAADE